MGDRQWLDWAEGMDGIVVDGQWTASGRAAPGLLSVRTERGSDRWARNFDSTTSWVGTPPAMRCRTQWGAETPSVPIHQFGCGVCSVEAARATASWFQSSHAPHPPSIARLCAPTRCQVRCRVSPQRTVCMEKIADLKDRPRFDGNGNSRKQSPRGQGTRGHHKEIRQKPNTFLACRVLLTIRPSSSKQPHTHNERNGMDGGCRAHPPASASGGLHHLSVVCSPQTAAATPQGPSPDRRRWPMSPGLALTGRPV